MNGNAAAIAAEQADYRKSGSISLVAGMQCHIVFAK
jgi:hypothetical protein